VSQIKLQGGRVDKKKESSTVHDRVKAIEQRVFNKSTSVDRTPGDRVLNQFFSSTQNPLTLQLHAN